MQISLNADSGSRLHSALKRYVTEEHPLVKELYLNLGGLKTVRVLSYYPGTEGILTREFHFSIVPPVAEPDATVYFWRETSVADLLKRCVGLNIEPAMDLESEWGARLSFGNEYYYGLDGLGPGSWFKEAHYFVHALFRIVNTPESFLVHGACVGVDGKGVLICARGGGGKSTLSVLSMLRGFEYVSDDFLILERKGTRVEASPIYSFITLSPQMYEHMYDDFGKARFLGVSPWKGKYILGMCRFVPEKHLHDLVDAYALLKAGHRIPNDVRLVLAGDTDFEDDYSLALKQKARDNGVVLTGFIRGKKLHSLLTNALCYSLPSSHEGLPIALLEAMSYRLPVITSAIPANLEVGLAKECYHEVGDVKALASKIEAIVNKPLQRIDYDMSKYNWDVIAGQVSEIYQSILT